jgi:hypothetical protein
MTPTDFVTALKKSCRSVADSTTDYLAKPEGRKPPEPLASLSAWYRGLSPSDQAMARTAIQYAADGSLFTLLSVIDGVASVTNAPGSLELYHVHDGTRLRLNDPDGELLYDIFNTVA